MFVVWLFEGLLAMIYDLSRHDGHMIFMFHADSPLLASCYNCLALPVYEL
jgi:hypothetical protein